MADFHIVLNFQCATNVHFTFHVQRSFKLKFTAQFSIQSCPFFNFNHFLFLFGCLESLLRFLHKFVDGILIVPFHHQSTATFHRNCTVLVHVQSTTFHGCASFHIETSTAFNGDGTTDLETTLFNVFVAFHFIPQSNLFDHFIFLCSRCTSISVTRSDLHQLSVHCIRLCLGSFAAERCFDICFGVLRNSGLFRRIIAFCFFDTAFFHDSGIPQNFGRCLVQIFVNNATFCGVGAFQHTGTDTNRRV